MTCGHLAVEWSARSDRCPGHRSRGLVRACRGSAGPSCYRRAEATSYVSRRSQMAILWPITCEVIIQPEITFRVRHVNTPLESWEQEVHPGNNIQKMFDSLLYIFIAKTYTLIDMHHKSKAKHCCCIWILINNTCYDVWNETKRGLVISLEFAYPASIRWKVTRYRGGLYSLGWVQRTMGVVPADDKWWSHQSIYTVATV